MNESASIVSMKAISRRYLICMAAAVLGSGLMAAVYLGFLAWAQGWSYAWGQLLRDRAYVAPIIIAFGVESALFAAIRYRLFAPVASAASSGAMVGTNGATSSAAMVACCLHHVASVAPILGISAAASFLAHYQREFLQGALALNLVAILTMLLVLSRASHQFSPVPDLAQAAKRI